MTGAVEIKRKPDGTRYVQPYMGVNAVTGRVMRPYKSFPQTMTDEEAERAAVEWLRELAPTAGRHVSYRLSDLLSEYIRSIEIRGRAANTVMTYRKLARYAIALAGRDVRKITTFDIDNLYDGLLQHGGRGGAPLSAETVGAFHAFLGRAFRWMVRNGILESSPIALAEKPSPSRKEARGLDMDEIETASAAIAANLGDPGRDGAAAFAAWLGLNMGLRVGEACAVRVCDVRIWIPDMHISGTVIEPKGGPVRQPKTKGKRTRNIAIPASGVDDVLARIACVQGIVGCDAKRAPLVTVDGSYMRPTAVSSAVSAMLHDAGLPAWATFHTLRHTHASALLAAGEDVKTVSERLGHANAATTLRIYAHAMPGRDARAAETFDRIRTGGIG